MAGKHWFWARSSNHSSSHCFFKVLINRFHQTLAIPGEFLTRFDVKLSETVLLKGSSGDTWKVGLTRTTDEVFLEHGWPQFVRDNALEEFNFLVFRYDGRNSTGNSQFRVLVFDTTGCEKEGLDPVDISEEPSSNTDGTQDAQFDKDSTSFVPESEDSSDGYECLAVNRRRNKKISKRASPVFVPESDDSSDDNVGLTTNRRGKKKISEAKHDFFATSRAGKSLECNPTRRKRTRDADHHIQQRETGTSKTATYNRYFKSHRRPVTAAEMARARRSALEVQSTKRHTFIKEMKASQVYKKFFVTIPLKFLEEYFHELPRSAVLRVPQRAKTWSVQITRTVRGGAGLNGGWSSFVMDNNLEEGDACLFELNVGHKRKPSDSNNAVFDVFIFRVVEEIVPLSNVRVTL